MRELKAKVCRLEEDEILHRASIVFAGELAPRWFVLRGMSGLLIPRLARPDTSEPGAQFAAVLPITLCTAGAWLSLGPSTRDHT